MMRLITMTNYSTTIPDEHEHAVIHLYKSPMYTEYIQLMGLYYFTITGMTSRLLA
jgi:hypothetical protein